MTKALKVLVVDDNPVIGKAVDEDKTKSAKLTKLILSESCKLIFPLYLKHDEEFFSRTFGLHQLGRLGRLGFIHQGSNFLPCLKHL